MKSSLLVILSCLFLAACDVELVHPSTRPVVGDYELLESESGKFYLVRKQDADQSGTGVVEGTVRQIGWNNRFILVDRKASFGGDKDGWMIVDAMNETIVGPFTDDELKSHSEAAEIHPHSAREAWNLLH